MCNTLRIPGARRDLSLIGVYERTVYVALEG